MINAIADGAVQLLHDNVVKLATTSTGIDVTGVIEFGDSHTIGDDGNDNLAITSSSGENIILGPAGGVVNLADDKKITFGTGQDLQIYHDASDSIIQDSGTGALRLLTNSLRVLKADASENIIQGTADGSVILYHDNGVKLTTATTGIDITGGFTATSGSTITTADNTVQLTLKSTDADGSVGPKFDLTRDSSSPADGDNCGQINFKIDNDAGESTQYGDIFVGAIAVADGSESAHMTFSTMKAGSRNSRMKLHSDETVFNEDSVDLDFRVETDGDSHALFVEGSTNFVGISENDPDRQLHVSSGTSNVVAKFESTDSTAAIEFTDNGGSAEIGTVNGAVVFFPGGAQKGLISSDGTLLLNQSTIAGIATATDSNSHEIGPGYMVLNRDDTATVTQIAFGKNGSIVGGISTTGSATSLVTSSDRRLKSNIQDAASASDKIDALQVRQFDWNVDGSHQDYGLVAQELQPIEPMAVSGSEDSDEMMGVDYSKLVPMLVKALQEAMTRIGTLETEVKALKGEQNDRKHNHY